MKNTIRNTTKVIAALALALTLTATIASAQSAYPPASLLAAQWWQWALAIPNSQSPLLDQTGQFAAVNQPKGNIWFLAGNGGGTTVRTVTIPGGKALFFPIANVIDVEEGIATPGGPVFLLPPNKTGPVRTARGFASFLISTA